ncbi:MAG: BREX-1 system phosphatase PglZ type A, partial [Sulfurovum sp.]
MIDIQKRLQTLFGKERLIFWYDDNAALKAEFEEVEIEGVEKRVIENNEFTLKRELLKLKPDTKFLIYSPTMAPSPENNWLLDLNIANHMFSADKISLILQSLGLDVNFKLFMARFEKFLNANKRVDALSGKIGLSESETSLALKMIAVTINSDDNIESILLKLFENQKQYEALEKLELTGELFKAVKSKYGYDGESLNDLLYKLLQNHFYYTIDRSKSSLNSDARLFINSWMDSSRYKESFKYISNNVSDELHIKGILEGIEPKRVLHCDTYEKCDQVVIGYLLKQLFSHSHTEEIIDSIHTRKNTFWYEYYKNIYNAILSAAKLIDFANKTEYKIKDFGDGISKYVADWHKADMYYREYSTYASRAEKLELLKDLTSKIEDMYLNGYLRELNDTWQKHSETYDVNYIDNHQQKFYGSYIGPIVEKNKKIFVIISDAMRYECGVELTSKILAENKKKDRFSAACSHMVSSLPSYTQLGMASLLPHRSLSIGDKNDTVFVDDKSSAGMANRDKILKSYNENSVAIGYEEFIGLDKGEGREFAKNHQVIYIYHDEIDKM